MHCPFCHNLVSDGQSFCSKCGKRLSTFNPSANRRFGIAIVVIIVILALTIGIWDIATGEFPHDVIEEQLSAIRSNKLTEAYYAYTSKEFQAATSLDDFKKFLKSFPELSKNNPTEFEDVEDQNNVKTVKGLITTESGEPFNLLYQLLEEDGKWKILNMKVIPAKSEKEEGRLTQTHLDVIAPVQDMLKSVEKGPLNKAYEQYTSQEFKKNTSLEAFKDFFINYPIITSYTKSELLDVAQAGNFAIVKYEFENDTYDTEADFTLIKEGSGWRVHGISIASQEIKPGAKEFNTEAILNPIRNELKLIQEDKLKQAYELTAKAFRESTPYKQFADFINTYQMFKTDTQPSFYKLNFNNNIAIYAVRFKDKSGQERETEFALIKEDNTWKILQIQVFEKETPPSAAKAK